MTQVSVQQAMDLAVKQCQAGQLAAARQVCAQIVQTYPNYAPAVHLLGVIAMQNGEHAQAEPLLRRAAQLAPDVPDFHNNLGVLHHILGRLDDVT